VAQKFAEAMGGTIFVDSQVGVGTKFTVEIPFKPLTPCTISKNFSQLSIPLSKQENAQIYIFAKGNLLEILTNYFSVWNLNFEVIDVEENEIRNMSPDDPFFTKFDSPNSYFLIDKEFCFCLKALLESKIHKTFCDSFHYIFFIPLSQLTSTIKFVEEVGHHHQVQILPKPLGPKKFHTAIENLLSGTNFKIDHQIPDSIDFDHGRSRFDSILNLQSKETNVLPNEKIQVLLVEDNMINRMLLSKHLSNLNVTYQVISSGEEAIDFWERSLQIEPIPLIFTDLEIEGNLNGLDVISKIRQREKKEGFIFIYLFIYFLNNF